MVAGDVVEEKEQRVGLAGAGGEQGRAQRGITVEPEGVLGGEGQPGG